jgi:23S rRNA (guanosine2251-2'-O)-methyltransferase
MIDKIKGTELIFGVHAIIELLKAKRRRLSIVYTTKPEPKAWGMVEKLFPKGLQIQYVTRDVLTKLANTPDHQGIVGYTTPFVYRKKFFDPATQPFLLMLDGIQDVRNLGAILRSAYCTNVSGVIITQQGSSPINAAALKASAGLAEHVDIVLVGSAKSGTQLLQQAGYALYLAVVKQGESAANVAYTKPLCLIIGSEGAGISKEIRSTGTLITLPQRNSDISYNASVAAGILLFIVSQKIGAI